MTNHTTALQRAMSGLPGRVLLSFVLACTLPACKSNKAPLAKGEERFLSNTVQLTSGFGKAGEAYFSPDMRWIIFQAAPKGEDHYQMYVAPLQWKFKHLSAPTMLTPLPGDVDPQVPALKGAGKPVRISPAPSRNTCGFFSPDKKSLLFASTAGKDSPNEPEPGYQRQGGNYRWAYPKGMEIYRADNWLDAVRAGKDTNLAQTPLTNNDAYDAEASYSPDGQWIVFTSNRTGDLELFVMRPDGSGVVQLTKTPGYDGGPFFAPDGKRLVYRSDRKSNDLLQVLTADLTFDAAGNITGLANERQLTDDANVNWGPYWHPHGRHVIYATSAHGHANYELYVMDAATGSNKRRVTYWPGFDGLPVLSPDGHWLLWSSKRSKDGTTQIIASQFTLEPR